jgi:hypothetical protein
VGMLLRLNMTPEAVGSAGSPVRSVFKMDLSEDLSNASGVGKGRFQVKSVAPDLPGRVLVGVNVLSDAADSSTPGDVSSLRVAQSLVSQVRIHGMYAVSRAAFH